MTSTYDHRIIEGAESGQFLQKVERDLQGEHGSDEQLFADLGAFLGPAVAARRRGRGAGGGARPAGGGTGRGGGRAVGRGAAPGRAGCDAAPRRYRMMVIWPRKLDLLCAEPEGDLRAQAGARRAERGS